MKKYLFVIFGLVLLVSTLVWAQETESSDSYKMIIRPYVLHVGDKCYGVSWWEKDYDAWEDDLVEISCEILCEPWWPKKITCVSTDLALLSPYKKWQKVYIHRWPNWFFGGAPMVSYFFKVIGEGYCDIILTVNDTSYTYHIHCIPGERVECLDNDETGENVEVAE